MPLNSRIISSLVFVAGLAHVGSCTVGLWGQCGGSSYSGDTTCESGSKCVALNDWFWQCQPSGSATTTTTTSSSSKTTTTSCSSTTTTTTTTSGGSTPTGCSNFVRTSGQKFTLGGSTFTVVGTNAYWLAQKTPTQADLDKAFADIAATGATTVRTWGFNEVTSASGTYYQSWSGSTPTINYGSNGLQKFDQVIASAKAHGLKLIVALTNNWQDYGGMDVYVKQIANSDNHDLFYTNSNVIQAFKNYIAVWVNRYKNEPTILAWELANEPRCHGTTGTWTGTCTTSTITQWVQNIGSYIKGLDSCHLVGIGDEGMGLNGDGTYPYTAYEGLDFPTNLAISSIDFGTAHLYPSQWGATSDPVGWGSQWITNHYTVQKQLNKPVILEEFGVTSSQYSTYQTWLSTVVSSGLAGDLIWQAGSTLSGGQTPQDGYAIFPSDSTYQLLTQHAAALKARG
ncbi:glycoside hydrolase family 5 protein [Tulasnella calospora MUT 4182]|uniref:mannan endo-1,4-beta-mannosidase n=1 Tax=Tulasnella calospora MUT 4182 TaxID=1051891 RepID=A0A0C3QQG2_9AGAM|nr:glycoside hydrolase family 5 protein [Tulasnella calospora MUT 4182]